MVPSLRNERYSQIAPFESNKQEPCKARFICRAAPNRLNFYLVCLVWRGGTLIKPIWHLVRLSRTLSQRPVNRVDPVRPAKPNFSHGPAWRGAAFLIKCVLILFHRKLLNWFVYFVLLGEWNPPEKLIHVRSRYFSSPKQDFTRKRIRYGICWSMLKSYGNFLIILAHFVSFVQGGRIILENPLQNLNRVIDFSEEKS